MGHNRQVEIYDEAKIGRLISGKSQHSVYEYGEGEVIKFDRFDHFLRGGTSRIEERHVELCKRYFGDLLLETRFTTSPHDSRIALIQPKIAGHYLSLKQFDNPVTRQDFLEMIESRSKLLQDGNPDIDFLGGPGLLYRSMSNVFVLPNGHLKIIDAFLVDSADIPFGHVIKYIIPLFLRRQQKTIDLFLAVIDGTT